MNRQRLTITLRSDVLKKLDKTVDGEIIRNRSHAIETFLMEKLRSKILKKAIMLGGGEGVEFKGKRISKLLLPIGGKTLVEQNIEILKKYGITDLILSLGDLGAQIREKLGDGSKYGIKVLYFERDRGTGGVLRQAKSLLEETFLMMNGDIYLEDVDIEDIYEFHKSNKSKGTIMLAAVNDPGMLGSVFMKGNLITKFSEKPKEGDEASHLINGGVYLLEPEDCGYVLPEEQSLENDVFPKLAKEKKLYGYLMDTPWIHLHDMEKYEAYLKSIK